MSHSDYFDLEEAPEGDNLLREEKKRKTVPSTCLLAGHLVMGFRMNKQDPCSQCPGPREKCGGRPMTATDDESGPSSPEKVRAAQSTGESSRRRDQRALCVTEILAIVKRQSMARN